MISATASRAESGSFAVNDGRIEDDPDLFALMMRDAAQQHEVWRPKSKWQAYAARIEREIAHNGVANVRSNYKILKGYASGGLPSPIRPDSGWKWMVWEGIERLPGLRKVLGEYKLSLKSEYLARRAMAETLARIVLEETARQFPDFRPPQGLVNGGADDGFLWRGQEVSAAWTKYVGRAVDLRLALEGPPLGAIMEIGPGLGLSTLAYCALNPDLKVVINVDIPPVLYVSTQFLKSIPDVAVVDYRESREMKRIDVRQTPGARTTIYQLAPWQIPQISGGVDVLLNAASFQEMDRPSCANYARYCTALTARAVMLHVCDPSLDNGASEVSAEFLTGLFRHKFPRSTTISEGWCGLNIPEHYVSILLQRP